MAVVVDVAQFAAALGYAMAPPGVDDEQGARLLEVAAAGVDSYVGAGKVPGGVATEAAIRIAAYLKATPGAVGALERLRTGQALEYYFRAPGSPLRRSGAMAILSPYRVRRALPGAPS